LALPLAFAESHQHFPDPTALTLLCAQGAQWAVGAAWVNYAKKSIRVAAAKACH